MADRLPPVVRRALRWASRLAFVLACAAVLLVVVVLTLLPRLTGGAALTVLTGSMTPDIPVGSVVLIRPVDPQTLEVGDVATYQVSPESEALVTHRVIKVRGAGDDLELVFKGDANRGADQTPVVPAQVRGEVWFHVPFLGSLRDAVQGMNVIVLLAPPLLALYAAGLLLSGARDRRRRTDPEPAPALDRQLLAARFRHDGLDSIADSPAELARTWGGLLLADDEDGFTVLLANGAPDADEVALLVRAMGPEAMWTCHRLDDGTWEALALSPTGDKEVADATA
jgi:signal peptidase